MNTFGFTLGAILLLKGLLRRAGQQDHGWSLNYSHPFISNYSSVLKFLSVILILFTSIHTLNSRASFDISTLRFTYFANYVSWLPHSYDKNQSLRELLSVISLVFFFWGTADWLKGGSIRSIPQLSGRRPDADVSYTAHQPLPERLIWLATTLTISTGALAFLGLLQKLDQSPKLLWLIEPTFLKKPEQHFGPFAYRGNASSYINLILPLSIFTLVNLRNNCIRFSRSFRSGSSGFVGLIPVVLIILAGAFSTNSRAGALIALCIVFVCALNLANRNGSRLKKLTIILVLSVITVSLLLTIGEQTVDRLRSTLETIQGTDSIKDQRAGRIQGRIEIYKHLPQMIEDYYLWGSGPGTFSSVFHLYRGEGMIRMGNYIPLPLAAWAHCDLVEFLITYGAFGMGLLLSGLALIILAIPINRTHSIRAVGDEHWLISLALLGFLLHSLVDFPLQVYSTRHVFILVLALALTASLIPKPHQ